MSHWLTAPEPLPEDRSGLPDPLARCGRHVLWLVVLGVAFSHGDWWRTHGETCPPGCRPLPAAAPANPAGFSQAAAAWAQLVGKTRKPRKPVDEWVKTERVVPLNLDALY
jgi:hypothetical protein